MAQTSTTTGDDRLSPDLTAEMERWERELSWAENALEFDPTNAFDVTRHAARELEAYADAHPELQPGLAELIARARVELDRSRAAAERFREEGAEREQHFHERELQDIGEPVNALRKPTD